MPLSVSTAYAAKNAAPARIPAYFVTFGDTDTKYSTHPEFLGGFDIGPTTQPGFFDVIPGPVPLQEGTTAFPYMAGISVSGGRVRPQEGSSSTGSLSVTLLDFEGAITALIGANIIAPGRSMTLYTGFGDINLGDFAVWMRGVIDDVQMLSPRVYTITAMERSSFQSQQVFHPAITKINTALSAGRLAIDLDSLAFFTAPTGGGSAYVTIDNEAIRFEAFSSGSVLDEVGASVLSDGAFLLSTVQESELLHEGDFTTTTKWTLGSGDFTFSGGAVVYTHSTGAGSFRQNNVDMAGRIIFNTRYRLTYTISGLSGTITSLRIGISDPNIEIPRTAGTHTVVVVGWSTAATFIVAANSSSGGFTLDNISLVELFDTGKWTREGDFEFPGGNGITYQDNTGSGTITQAANTLLEALVPGRSYRLYYTISNLVGAISSLEVPSGVAEVATPLSIADNGSYSVDFIAHASATAFSLQCASGGGASFRLSSLSLISLLPFTGIMAVERGALGSMASVHAQGAQVRELFRLAGHPLDIALSVLQNVGNLGMEILPEEIDSASFAAIKAETPTLEFEFLISAQEEGKRWLEEQIFAPLGCFLVTSADGTLRLRSITLDDPTNTITDDHILEPPTWRGNFGEAINALGVSYDHQMAGDVFHPASSDYGGRRIPEDATILETDRRQREHHLRGLRSALVNAEEFVDDYGFLIFAHYALGPATVALNAMLAKHVVEQGDFVDLSSLFLPNRLTGALGLAGARALVLGRDLDFVNGYIHLELQLMGIEVTALWASLAEFPLGTETYATANEQQREDFAFWADDDGENDGAPAKNWR